MFGFSNRVLSVLLVLFRSPLSLTFASDLASFLWMSSAPFLDSAIAACFTNALSLFVISRILFYEEMAEGALWSALDAVLHILLMGSNLQGWRIPTGPAIAFVIDLLSVRNGSDKCTIDWAMCVDFLIAIDNLSASSISGSVERACHS